MSHIKRAWRNALEQAARTPARRNRYVDFVRAVAIVVVVFGHWLMAAPSVQRGDLTLSDLLAVAPWSQWLTWIFQVMPLFFIVGGYANGASWSSARRAGQHYGVWIAVRLRRLAGPVVPLLALWVAAAVLARALGVEPGRIQLGSQAALVPTWFLAVYILVVMAVPATCAWWARSGWRSCAVLAGAAVVVDAASFGQGMTWLRWFNYAFVWLALHQLGYAWRAERLGGAVTAAAAACLALAGLIALVAYAFYPVSMVTVPGEPISNTRPPTVALLFLGALHLGVVRLVEAPTRRWLERPQPWCLAVLINRRIMTLYLWHATALVGAVGLAHALGGFGLTPRPGSAAWWWTRPLWIAACTAALIPCLALFGRFEGRAHRVRHAATRPLQTWLAASALSVGLAALASGGVGSAGPVGIRVGWVVWTLAAALLAARGYTAVSGRSPS